MDRGDAACRGRIHLPRRRVGGAVQDRWQVGRRRADYLADGTQAGEAIKQSRRDVVGKSRHFARQLAGADRGDRQGRVGNHDTRITAAPLPIKDKIIVGASGGDSGVRDWIAGLDAASGKVLWRKFTIPAPGEPGSETWKDANNAWQTGGAALWVTGTYDPATNQTIWGTGNPVPMFDPTISTPTARFPGTRRPAT